MDVVGWRGGMKIRGCADRVQGTKNFSNFLYNRAFEILLCSLSLTPLQSRRMRPPDSPASFRLKFTPADDAGVRGGTARTSTFPGCARVQAARFRSQHRATGEVGSIHLKGRFRSQDESKTALRFDQPDTSSSAKNRAPTPVGPDPATFGFESCPKSPRWQPSGSPPSVGIHEAGKTAQVQRYQRNCRLGVSGKIGNSEKHNPRWRHGPGITVRPGTRPEPGHHRKGHSPCPRPNHQPHRPGTSARSGSAIFR